MTRITALRAEFEALAKLRKLRPLSADETRRFHSLATIVGSVLL